MKQEQKKSPLEQPELPNIPPRPKEIKQVYLVTIIDHKKRIYCKVDYNQNSTDQETLGEIFLIVRQLERILNKLKKNNIEIKHQLEVTAIDSKITQINTLENGTDKNTNL